MKHQVRKPGWARLTQHNSGDDGLWSHENDYVSPNELKALADLGVPFNGHFEGFDSRFHYALMIGRLLRALPGTYDLTALAAFFREDLILKWNGESFSYSDRARAVLALVEACEPEWLLFNVDRKLPLDGRIGVEPWPWWPLAMNAWHIIANGNGLQEEGVEWPVDRHQTQLAAFRVGPSHIEVKK